MLVKKSADSKVREFQDFNDDVYVLSKILRVHPSQTKLWRKNQAQVSELRKAMNITTSGEGGSWVPTEFSAELIDKFRLNLKVAALFRRVTMPTNPYTFPVVASDANAYLVSESTADDGSEKFTASTPGTSSFTLTAKKLAARTVFSEEMTEDAIVPVLPFVKDNLARVMADAQETAILNGATGTHFDIDITSSADRRKAYNGLRYH
jgi:HK97 family phage major capsid protein